MHQSLETETLQLCKLIKQTSQFIINIGLIDPTFLFFTIFKEKKTTKKILRNSIFIMIAI